MKTVNLNTKRRLVVKAAPLADRHSELYSKSKVYGAHYLEKSAQWLSLFHVTLYLTHHTPLFDPPQTNGLLC